MPMLADLLFGAVDGAFAVDASQHIVFWNPACEQLLKRPAREVLGQRCCAVLQGRNVAGKPVCSPDCPVTRLAQGGSSPDKFSMWVENGDGAKQCLAVSIALLPSPRVGQWTVVHLLHCREAVATLDLLEGSVQRRPRPASENDGQEPHPCAPPKSGLTAREDQIFRLLAEGLPVDAISQRLHISPVTVRNHLQRLMTKLGLHSQRETVAYAYRHQLI